MNKFYQKRILNFTTKQLFDIVIDVESYPNFLPWCKETEILNRKDNYNFDAILTVGYQAINESYTSEVNSVYLKYIKSTAIKGPFKILESTWKFKNLNKSCEIEFAIQYEFKSFFLGKVMGGLFKKASEKMFEAFEERAKKLHGQVDNSI